MTKRSSQAIRRHIGLRALCAALLLAVLCPAFAVGEWDGTPFFDPTFTMPPVTPPAGSLSGAYGQKEHFALRARDCGPCDKLLGDAYIILAFVSTPQHPWTQTMKDRVGSVSRSSIAIMESEAKRYGARLSLQLGILDFSVPYEYGKDKQWYKYILDQNYDPPVIAEALDYYRGYLNVDTVAMIFLFNSWDRSYTTCTSRDYPNYSDEYCVIFCDTDMHDNYLTHEVLHLYGAIDYYDYDGEGVQKAAYKYFPDSDMMYPSHVVDELTAYLIGWTDTLTYKARAFLAETEGLR